MILSSCTEHYRTDILSQSLLSPGPPIAEICNELIHEYAAHRKDELFFFTYESEAKSTLLNSHIPKLVQN